MDTEEIEKKVKEILSEKKGSDLSTLHENTSCSISELFGVLDKLAKENKVNIIRENSSVKYYLIK